MLTALLIIAWAISVYLSYSLGKQTGTKKHKKSTPKKVAEESEQLKKLKNAEHRFWHFDGDDKQ